MAQKQSTAANTPLEGASLSASNAKAELSSALEPQKKATLIISQTVVFFTQLSSSISEFWNQYKPLVWSIALLIGLIVGLRVIIAVIDALNDIPFVEPTFQLIGSAYSIWFGWRYLIKPETRQELAQKFQAFFNSSAEELRINSESERNLSNETKQLYRPSELVQAIEPDELVEIEPASIKQGSATEGTQFPPTQKPDVIISSNETEQLYKPGELAPTSGLYELISSDGSSEGREVTSTKGEHFPPTPESGMHYQLVDATLHKSNQESPNQLGENITVNIGSEQLYKPGEIVPTSGQYQLMNPDGVSEGREVTSTKGEHFPPTPEPGMHYQLVDPTQHKHN